MRNACPALAAAALIPATLWLTGCAAPERVPVAVQEQEWTSPTGLKGVQLLTEHFDLRVTAQDAILREYLPTFMEEAFRQYAALLPPVRGSSERLTVYLFDNRDQWAAFTRGFSPEHADTYLHILSGGYTDHASATSVAYDLHRDRTLALLAHEGLHQHLARYFPEPVPAWINEGLATQFEQFELDGPFPQFTPRHNYFRRNNLRELVTEAHDGLIPLPDLLTMDAGQAVRGIRHGSRAYYAQIWSLALFLKDGPCPPEYQEGFGRLLVDLGTDRMRTAIRAQRVTTPDSDRLSDGEMLFRHYITEDLAAADGEYRAFAQALLR